MIEYGAVEKFSGINSIGDGYQINFDYGDTNDPAPFNKLQIWVLKRMKDVYATSGLAAVWQTINQLGALTGSPVSSGPILSEWSLKEVLGLAQLPAQGGAQSLKALAAFLVNTQPLDTPYSNAPATVIVSLRELLTNVPH